MGSQRSCVGRRTYSPLRERPEEASQLDRLHGIAMGRNDQATALIITEINTFTGRRDTTT
jgi:hypothetical protein